MTTTKLRAMIDKAVKLDREIEEKEAELKDLKESLKAEAVGRDDEHEQTAGGGWSWSYAGTTGEVVRVTQEGDKLKSGISAAKEIDKIMTLIGKPNFLMIFLEAKSYKPTAKIRELAEELMGKKMTKKLLAMITTKGRVTVGFETKEVAK